MGARGKSFGTAASRWEGIGPYYAMFPSRFAAAIIKSYTSLGDTVIDPFAGRGTTIFSANALGRRGLGVEISPVGWVYSKAKLAPAPLSEVERRLNQLAHQSDRYTDAARALPPFFKRCFAPGVRRFLLTARAHLDWRRSAPDRTLMALLLVYLHGKSGYALSNQMRQTKAMSPRYAIQWWAERGLKPPTLDVVDFITERIRWRYAKGVVESDGSQVFLGDSVSVLPEIARHFHRRGIRKAKLLLTSPPYFGVTNYHYDQWLRLWLLGFEEEAYVPRGPSRGRFTNPEHYQHLLDRAFDRAAALTHRDAVIYVRTAVDKFTRKATRTAVRNAFPHKRLVSRLRPFKAPTQTQLFGDRRAKAGEVDLILLPT